MSQPTTAPRARRRPAAWISLAAAGSLLLGACADPTEEEADEGQEGEASGAVTIGSADFPESEVVAYLYAHALEDSGVEVSTSMNIGSREAYVPALEDGSIDLIPEYTGNLLFYLEEDSEATDADSINDELPAALEERGLEMLTPAEAESTDAVVVTSETAEDWDLTTIGDLADQSEDITFAGPPEFQERSVGIPGLEENYGLEISEFTPISDGGGPATVDALVSGDVTAANIFTTSPALPENDLVVLEDPESNFPAQQVVPIISSDAMDEDIAETLDAVSELLSTDELIELNDRVSGSENQEPSDAARDWLEEQGLIEG
ncbi:ABC transporter substrate-binding protein [Nesterenkonia sp. NBAIMH1]|uniref:ABC transporter substrate-binding protein n=1 Tax=Nesterenkonia sp. NBAIMH1 TaxID=2600320 RepID=UPI0011B4CBF5|nr:ABC transporter substrate-binding protein [Nesterenkonia sp. NBAIMH1]